MTIQQNTNRLAASLAALLTTACLFTACTAIASTNNLLINGSFSNGDSGWSKWTSGGWINVEIPDKLNPANGNYWAAGVGVYDGTPQLTCGQNNSGPGAYAWQIIAAAENVEYTLAIQGGAENWWWPQGEIRLIFQDASNAELGRNVVSTTGSFTNWDMGVPYQNWTNAATAPTGTRKLKVEICCSGGNGSIWFDNASLTAPIDPPVIANVYPNGTMLLQATNKLSFTAHSAAPINGSGVQVVLNGVDVSGSLAFAGSGTTNISVSYTGLASNRLHTAVITVTDPVNLSTFTTVNFDTYAPLFTWEAEDYDYNYGQYINHADPIRPFDRQQLLRSDGHGGRGLP